MRPLKSIQMLRACGCHSRRCLCPANRLARLLGRRYVVSVLSLLTNAGTRRFVDLRTHLKGVSASTLAAVLEICPKWASSRVRCLLRDRPELSTRSRTKDGDSHVSCRNYGRKPCDSSSPSSSGVGWELGFNVDVDHDGHLFGIELPSRSDFLAELRRANALQHRVGLSTIISFRPAMSAHRRAKRTGGLAAHFIERFWTPPADGPARSADL